MRSSSSKGGNGKSRPPPPPPDSNSGLSESAEQEPQSSTTPASTSPTLPSPFICKGRQFHLQVKPENHAAEKRELMKGAIRKCHLAETNPEQDYADLMRKMRQRKEEDARHMRLKQELQQLEVDKRVLQMALAESAAQN